jgi:hypothetical protein
MNASLEYLSVQITLIVLLFSSTLTTPCHGYKSREQSSSSVSHDVKCWGMAWGSAPHHPTAALDFLTRLIEVAGISHTTHLATRIQVYTIPKMTESGAYEARTSPTADELSRALTVSVYDKEGKTHALGDFMNGKRTALIFIRLFCTRHKVFRKTSHCLRSKGA